MSGTSLAIRLAMKRNGSSSRFPALWYVIIGLVIVMGIARLWLPAGLENYVNRQINRTQDYGGRIGNVRVQLWRGRYRIDQVKIFKRNGAVHVPLFAADQLYLSVEWKELFHGSIVGEILMKRPRLNFVSGPSGAQSQTGKDESWNQVLESLFPFRLNRLEIDDGEIHFQNEYSTPPVDIYLSRCSVVATNLSNSRDIRTELPAGVTVSGTSVGGGNLDIQIQLNPIAAAPTYQTTAQITNVDLPALNDFLKAYGKFDVESGTFDLFTSIASKEGKYDGYAKVFFSHLHIFAWEKERTKNVLEVFWQGIVGTLAAAFKNQPHDYLATRIPISGSYGTEKIGVWPAIGSLLRNAFIKALVPKVDEKVTVESVDQKTEKPAEAKGPSVNENGAESLVKPEHQ
jgi:hypothetical protein